MQLLLVIEQVLEKLPHMRQFFFYEKFSRNPAKPSKNMCYRYIFDFSHLYFKYILLYNGKRYFIKYV